MSVNANYNGGIQSLVCQTLAGATTTKIGLTATDSSLVLASWSVTNDTAGTVNAYLYWYSAATSTESLVWQKAIVTKDTAVESNIPIRLRTGDEIRVKAASTMTVSLVYSLNFPNGIGALV